jgi:hypothetical protein
VHSGFSTFPPWAQLNALDSSRPNQPADCVISPKMSFSATNFQRLTCGRMTYYTASRCSERSGARRFALVVTLDPRHQSVAHLWALRLSAFRPGISALVTGLRQYRIGTHGLSKPKASQYTAHVQAAPVTVLRRRKGQRRQGAERPAGSKCSRSIRGRLADVRASARRKRGSRKTRGLRVSRPCQ